MSDDGEMATYSRDDECEYEEKKEQSKPIQYKVKTNSKTGKKRICIDVPDETYDIINEIAQKSGLRPLTWGRMVFFRAIREHEEGKYIVDDRASNTRRGRPGAKDAPPVVEFSPHEIKRILNELKEREARVKKREQKLEEIINQHIV